MILLVNSPTRPNKQRGLSTLVLVVQLPQPCPPVARVNDYSSTTNKRIVPERSGQICHWICCSS